MTTLIDNKNYSLKKNNIDNLFLNLSENPQELPNKDFRLQLSTIYQLFEDEFAGIFEASINPLRQTDFYFIQNKNQTSIFVTPINNFDFYLKSKGSLYRFKSEFREINGIQQEGYLVPISVIWDYFNCFNEILNFEDGTKTFNYINKFTQTILKIIEKLYFIPNVILAKDLFTINYEMISDNKDIIAMLSELDKSFPDEILTLNQNKNRVTFLNDLQKEYFNYIIFKFLSIKAAKFKDAKSAHYFVKNLYHKRFERRVDVGANIVEWLDEMYIGQYNIVPVIYIEKIVKDEFAFKIKIKNKLTEEVIDIKEIEGKDEIFGYTSAVAIKNIEKQLNYIIRYFPEFMDRFENIEDPLILSLNEVYNFMTQTTYQLQKATVDVILPDDFNKIVVPRASINATVKKNREGSLYEYLITNKTSSISLDDILDFSYSIAIGSEKLSLEEFEANFKDVNGLVEYKNMYVLFDKAEYENILDRLNKQKLKPVTKFDLLHAALSGQIKEYDFDYDAAFAKVIQDLGKVEEVSVSENLNGELRPYQEKGFKWLWTNISKGFGCCMADDMGLGKTVQVISFLLKLKDTKKLKYPAIVVCPTTLVGNWIKELNNFAPSLTVSVYQGAERQLDLKKDIIITTYSILRIDIEQFVKHKWGVVVVDEAQNIKNPDTAQTQSVKSLKSEIKIAMTGTPVENRLTELWSIFDFINTGYLGTLRDFQKSYAIPIERFKELPRAEKLKLSVSPFILRRLKSDKTIITDLPEKIVMDEYCYLAKAQAALYEKVLNDLMAKISAQTGINRRGLIFKLITALKQICNHPYQYLKAGDKTKEASGKCEKFLSLTQNILDNNEKLIVFTQYKEMGHILESVIQDEFNFSPLFFHGSLSRSQRDEMLNSFEEDVDKKIMILSLKAGGTGVNLVQATNVIHYDLWWNPAVEDQATDRTYRIGQHKNVMVHRLINIGTFEEKINEMIKNKKELANLAVFEGEKIITELSDDEIYKIFTLAS